MSRTRAYCKLVRDKIPEELSQKPIRYETQRVTGEEYRQALLEKLVEEANEALEAGDTADALKVELADLREVIEALVDAYDGLEYPDVVQTQIDKWYEKGGFDKGVILLWVQNIDLTGVDDA